MRIHIHEQALNPSSHSSHVLRRRPPHLEHRFIYVNLFGSGKLLSNFIKVSIIKYRNQLIYYAWITCPNPYYDASAFDRMHQNPTQQL